MRNFLIVWIVCFIGGAGTVSAQHDTGAWNGILLLPGGGVKLVLHIDRNEGGYTASLDSPAQGPSESLSIPFVGEMDNCVSSFGNWVLNTREN